MNYNDFGMDDLEYLAVLLVAERYRSTFWLGFMFGGLAMLVLVAFVLLLIVV